MHWQNSFNDSKKDIKQTWNKINTILGRNKDKNNFPDIFKHENNQYNSEKDISNGFNDYFVNVGPKLSSRIPDTQYVSPRQLHNLPHSFYLTPTSELEVISVINKLKPKSSYGYDEISAKMIKDNSNSIAAPLTYIVNLSFKTGIFPDDLKRAKVIPIFKSKNNATFENYRPISLLPTFSKIAERLVYNRLYKYVKSNCLLNSAQYGFQKKLSTEFAILELQNRIINNLSDDCFCIGIFIDLSKAFDTLDHSILLDKLNSIGIRGIAHNWLASYLENRTQFTEYLSCHSELRNVSCGVPQGSILGPLLFLLYINDLTTACKDSKPILFADDTTLIYHDIDEQVLHNKVNSELDTLYNWFASNKLSLNIEKTQLVKFERSRPRIIPDYLPHIKINNTIIHESDFVKFLGVYIDKSFSWKEHISRKCSQISKIVGTLSRLKNILPNKVLVTIYNSLILPCISYGAVAWGNTDPKQTKRLNILQKRAVRIIDRQKYNSHTSPILKKLKLLTAKDIFQLEYCKIFAKFCLGELPPYLTEQLMRTERTESSYNMRHTSNILPPLTRNKQQEQVISFRIASAWNSLPESIKSFRSTPTTIKTFCKHFKDYKINNYQVKCNIPNCYICSITNP